MLELIRGGLSNPEIADRLGIGREGVKYHVSEILSKLGVSSREEAARWRMERERPRWLRAAAPLFFWRRLIAGKLSTALAAGLFVAVAAGIALLLWALLITRGGASLRVVALAAGGSHTCVLTNKGGVRCWGDNSLGALGDGTTTDRTTPVDVIGLTAGVVAISAGGSDTCALTKQGGVKCWGDNRGGALGDGQACGIVCPIPVDVRGLASGVKAIGGVSCAITTAGGVKCWPGNGQQDTPADVRGLTSGVVALSAGSPICALTMRGGVICWANGLETPEEVAGLPGRSVAVEVSGDQACAISTTHSAKCWGLGRNYSFPVICGDSAAV